MYILHHSKIYHKIYTIHVYLRMQRASVLWKELIEANVQNIELQLTSVSAL